MSLFTKRYGHVSMSPTETLASIIVKGVIPEAKAFAQLPPGLDALNKLLRSEEWSGLPIHVTLCDSFAKYLTITPADGLHSINELNLYVASCFENAFGINTSDWDIQGDWRANDATIAVALPRSLIAEIGLAANAAKCRIRAINPYFIQAFNECCHSISADTAWLLVIAGSQATIAALSKGLWIGVRSQSFSNEVSAGEIQSLVQRCALQFGMQGTAPVFICGSPSPQTRDIAKHVYATPLEKSKPKFPRVLLARWNSRERIAR